MNDFTRFRFGDFTLDVGTHQLRCGTETVDLSKLSFLLLCKLVEAAPNVVTHDELASSIWGPRRIVTPENLAKRVMLLRRALGDQARTPHYIAGVRGVGYRLACKVEVADASPETGLSRAARASSETPLLDRRLRHFAVALTAAALAFVAIAAALVDEGTADGEDAPPPTARAADRLERTLRIGNVRIDVEVRDAETEKLLWADSYEGAVETEDLPAIRSEIERSIAAGLTGEVTQVGLVSADVLDDLAAADVLASAAPITAAKEMAAADDMGSADEDVTVLQQDRAAAPLADDGVAGDESVPM